MENDELYMRQALSLAREAEKIDEVPVGAVIVRDGQIIAQAYNMRESKRCATAHAELLAIEQACRRLGGWRLPGATLYVTLEPCPMCAGAVVNSRIERVVYAARDTRFGALGSLFDMSKMELNHKPEVTPDVLGDEARELLSEYFRRKRKKKVNQTEDGSLT